MRWYSVVIIGLLGSSLCIGQAQALAEISVGLKSGRVVEAVHANGRLLSELLWKIPCTPVMQIKFSSPLFKEFYVQGSYLQALANTHSNMTDRDWDVLSEHHVLTTFSDSPTDFLKNKEASVGLYLNILNRSQHRVALGLDYRYQEMTWQAHGGYYINHETETVSLWAPDLQVIRLEQYVYIPHIVGMYESGANPWGWTFTVAMSPVVKIREDDYHFLRSKMFHDFFDEVDWAEAGTQLFYQGQSGWRIGVGFTLNHVFKKYGDILSYYVDEPEVYYHADLASTTATQWSSRLYFKCPF